jgi:predicted Zn-dependent protease
MKMKKIIAVLLTASTLVFSGCASTTKDSVSGTGRKQFLMLPSSYVTSLSNKAYLDQVSEASKNNALNVDKAQVERVRRISNRLIKQTGALREGIQDWKWEVNVEKNEQVNAYCMPGGKIMVFTGLIDGLKITDDELGAVIGHEIAHALREHGRERMSQGLVQEVGLKTLLGLIGGQNSAALTQLSGMAGNLFFTLPNGRGQETEADKIGLELSARAGYNPNAAVTLWQKMDAQGGQKPPQFLSTHPASATRIKELQALIPSMMPLYQAAPKS